MACGPDAMAPTAVGKAPFIQFGVFPSPIPEEFKPSTSAVNRSKTPAAQSSLIERIYLSPFKAPDMIEGIPSASFDLATKDRLISRVKFVLIAKFSHGKPTFRDFQTFLSKFRFKGSYVISMFDSKHVFVEFADFQDFVKLWVVKSCMVYGFRVRFFQWSENFSPARESSFAPVWVLLPRLPLYLLEEEALLSIASKLGKPLLLDPLNLDHRKVGAACFCVAIDVSEPLPEAIWLSFKSQEKKVGSLYQKIIFQDPPPFCKICKHLGHNTEGCKVGLYDESKPLDTRGKSVGILEKEKNGNTGNAHNKNGKSHMGISELEEGEIAGSSNRPTQLEKTGNTGVDGKRYLDVVTVEDASLEETSEDGLFEKGDTVTQVQYAEPPNANVSAPAEMNLEYTVTPNGKNVTEGKVMKPCNKSAGNLRTQQEHSNNVNTVSIVQNVNTVGNVQNRRMNGSTADSEEASTSDLDIPVQRVNTSVNSPVAAEVCPKQSIRTVDETKNSTSGDSAEKSPIQVLHQFVIDCVASPSETQTKGYAEEVPIEDITHEEAAEKGFCRQQSEIVIHPILPKTSAEKVPSIIASRANGSHEVKKAVTATSSKSKANEIIVNPKSNTKNKVEETPSWHDTVEQGLEMDYSILPFQSAIDAIPTQDMEGSSEDSREEDSEEEESSDDDEQLSELQQLEKFEEVSKNLFITKSTRIVSKKNILKDKEKWCYSEEEEEDKTIADFDLDPLMISDKDGQYIRLSQLIETKAHLVCRRSVSPVGRPSMKLKNLKVKLGAIDIQNECAILVGTEAYEKQHQIKDTRQNQQKEEERATPKRRGRPRKKQITPKPSIRRTSIPKAPEPRKRGRPRKQA